MYKILAFDNTDSTSMDPHVIVWPNIPDAIIENPFLSDNDDHSDAFERDLLGALDDPELTEPDPESVLLVESSQLSPEEFEFDLGNENDWLNDETEESLNITPISQQSRKKEKKTPEEIKKQNEYQKKWYRSMGLEKKEVLLKKQAEYNRQRKQAKKVAAAGERGFAFPVVNTNVNSK
ncbi:hypothetical protein HOH87_02620 [bacterium]|jgi:hypothetical protein|nr:hypothetical protein [bacterium]